MINIAHFAILMVPNTIVAVAKQKTPMNLASAQKGFWSLAVVKTVRLKKVPNNQITTRIFAPKRISCGIPGILGSTVNIPFAQNKRARIAPKIIVEATGLLLIFLSTVKIPQHFALYLPGASQTNRHPIMPVKMPMRSRRFSVKKACSALMGTTISFFPRKNNFVFLFEFARIVPS